MRLGNDTAFCTNGLVVACLISSDLRIQISLLMGHADLNQHLTPMKVRSDPTCSICQEEEETALHLLGRCSTLSTTRSTLLGLYCLDYADLGNMHCPLLLKFAKASWRFL